MLEVSRIRNEKEEVVQGLKKRGWSDEALKILDDVISADDSRKQIQTENDSLLSKRNSLSKEIGKLFQTGQADLANETKKQVDALKDEISRNEKLLHERIETINNYLFKIPNVPNLKVPEGLTEDDNKITKDWNGKLINLGDNALAHWDLAKKYNILDFELGVKITGAGFPVFRNKGARLQRALINFFLDEAINAGYEEIVPPHLVNAKSAMGTGSLPDKEGQMYYIEKDDLYIIPTAEVPVTNILRDEIVKESDFPFKYTAYTPCFRREAGSYGSDVKGLNRVHQFDKIEIVQVQHPDKSHDTLNEMVTYVEGLLTKLELPYRILCLCGGDLTFASALTYDFEVYSAAQKKWLEVSSVSNFETFQTNRLKLRYKDEKGKSQLAHTLNGSALALARIIAALLENNQTEEGILIPEALRRYTGFDILN
ncbi:MAG: serine--tRNA ligase [Saprospiraceae bacterium]|nr:serine--tRNA ligase [Bacteroidia bacterium]NNE13593.1 serine--tRNA ligase [Saprospiraceae bacterium]NNL92924.1 serine--tRNA ligase [Saprospiraceae bacterium]